MGVKFCTKFPTPLKTASQCVVSDIENGLVDISRVRLVIVDEAHRALGEYAYCKVIRLIKKYHSNFRIVGLTATPERDKFFEVVKNLHIQDISHYSTEHPEVSKFSVTEVEQLVGLTKDQVELLQPGFLKNVFLGKRFFWKISV